MSEISYELVCDKNDDLKLYTLVCDNNEKSKYSQITFLLIVQLIIYSASLAQWIVGGIEVRAIM